MEVRVCNPESMEDKGIETWIYDIESPICILDYCSDKNTNLQFILVARKFISLLSPE